MKTNARIFYILTVFYAIDAVIYGWLSTQWEADNKLEVIGTAAIAMLAILSAFVGFYIDKSARAMGGIAPEDRDGNIEEGDSEIGFFSPWSWWPLALGIGSALAFASLAIGWWLTFIAIPLALIALIGFVFEYSRGQHAH